MAFIRPLTTHLLRQPHTPCKTPHRPPSHLARAMANTHPPPLSPPSEPPQSESAALTTAVLTHWFGSPRPARNDTLRTQGALWYGGSADTDAQIRARFLAPVEDALAGRLQALAWPSGGVADALALTVLLDQYPRNVFRGTSRAYAGDAAAAVISRRMLLPDALEAAAEAFGPVVRYTFLLPLMHQEEASALDLCVDGAYRLVRECEEGGVEFAECARALRVCVGHAEEHREILRRFGRYPHRNEVLGRESTREEVEFLRDGPRFGQ